MPPKKPNGAEFAGFSAPVVTRKAYLAKGPSGWLETFDRARSDAALVTFLGLVPLEEAVDLFKTQRELAEDPEDKLPNWHTVVGFLARTMGVTPLAVPYDVGVAFWGHYVLALSEQGAN